MGLHRRLNSVVSRIELLDFLFQQNLSTTQLVCKYRSYKVSKYLRTQQGLDITGSNLSRVIQLVSCILTSLICTMSEATTGVLKFAFGLISNKLQFRELDNIKSKLDTISRKDLWTSINCLQQGVNHLIMSFGDSSESGNPSTSEIPSTGACSIETKPAQQLVTVEDPVALANAIAKLTIESNERFELAIKSFQEAGKEARRAFHNAALSTEERILASKVRMASGILQHLDNLELAASDCLHCLQELNDMPAVQEVFSVLVKGGMKSVFKKQSRTEIVETVTMINWVLADFISKFTTRRMAVFDWPMIRWGKQVIHPGNSFQ